MRWLREEIGLTEIRNCDVWLIGSVAAAKPAPKDCDLLIIAPICDLDPMIEAINSLKDNFVSAFGVPLHLTIISTEELGDTQVFLSEIFQKPSIKL